MYIFCLALIVLGPENMEFKVPDSRIYVGPWISAFGATKGRDGGECIRTTLKSSVSFRKIENLEVQRSQESA